MQCYGERYKHLYLPGPGYGAESIQQCPARLDGCSNTCHPLSIIKGPAPRWQSYPQPLAYVCPQPSVSQASLLACQPYVQKCVVLYPEPCETTRLLPCGKPGPAQSRQPCESPRPEKKRVAKSLPPCAPRCPEPGRLRFPPCGIRYSASCQGEGRSPRLAKSSSRWYGPDLRPPGLTGGYSLPLRGVTECPPQQPCLAQPSLRERAGGFAPHKCTKGYPTQECVPPCPSEQRLAKGPAGKGLEECPAGKAAEAKISPPPPVREGVKAKGSVALHPGKSRCLYPRAAHRPGHHHHHHHHHHSGGGAKRSSHPKKSRCASKWIW